MCTIPFFSRVVMGFGSIVGAYWYVGVAAVIIAVFSVRKA